jgi:hypothetical protein
MNDRQARDHLVRRLPGATAHDGDRRGYCECCRASVTLVEGGAVALELGEEAGHKPGCPHRPPQLPSGRRARVATDGGERP